MASTTHNQQVTIQPTDAFFFTWTWLANVFKLTGGGRLARLWTNHMDYGGGRFGEEALTMPTSTLTFIINTLLAFVEIKSQGHAEFPFGTHPKPTMLSVTSLLMYAFTCAAQLLIPVDSVCATIARFTRIGLLCVLVASLASLFYF